MEMVAVPNRRQTHATICAAISRSLSKARSPRYSTTIVSTAATACENHIDGSAWIIWAVSAPVDEGMTMVAWAPCPACMLVIVDDVAEPVPSTNKV